jgi:DNA-binding transcriptional MerR regulator
MSLSTCTQKVRITSPNGNLLSEGEMECKNIATLKNLGYTIEELEEVKEPDYVAPEPIPVVPTALTPEQIEQQQKELEQLQIEAEQQEAELQEVIIQEPLPQIFEIQETNLIERGLEIATENINLQSQNQTLLEEAQTLQNFINNWESNLPFKDEKEYHEFLLQKEVERVHSMISAAKSYVGNHPKPSGREIEFNNWSNSTTDLELGLEKFARDLGLTYTRRSEINGEPFYYKTPAQIKIEEQKEWVSYIPTSSAVVRDF